MSSALSRMRAALHALIAGYLCITLLAVLYTLTHWQGFLLGPLVRYSYFMTAPYQGYNPQHTDLYAEGQLSDGTWQEVNLDRYFPGLLGERMARTHLLVFRWMGQEKHLAAYRAWTMQLLAHERERGTPYTSLRLSWDSWPMSPDRYEALRVPPYLVRTLLAEVKAEDVQPQAARDAARDDATLPITQP